MKRVLFDTSVYGELLLDLPSLAKTEGLLGKKIIVYGNKVIRNELRDISSKSKLGKFSKRILLLSLYDKITGDHEIKIGDIIRLLAGKYFEEYRKLGGKYSYDEIGKDFVIISSASIKELDIIVSHDTITMLSKQAIQSYKRVNSENGLKNPNFIPYEEYKKKLELIDSPV